MFDLRKSLMEARPVDEKEAQNIRDTLLFLNENEDKAYDRACKEGHITGSAVVVDCYGRILLNHNKKKDLWIQFGGHAKKGENVLQTALRETSEESGFDLSQMRILNEGIFDCAIYDIVANETKGDPAHKHYDINFLVMVDSDEYRVSEESVELKWCSFYEALDMAKNDVDLTRMILKTRVLFDKITREKELRFREMLLEKMRTRIRNIHFNFV